MQGQGMESAEWTVSDVINLSRAALASRSQTSRIKRSTQAAPVSPPSSTSFRYISTVA